MNTIPRLQQQPGFRLLSEAKIMLAYIKRSPLTLDYCRDSLSIESPLRVVRILNNLGKQVGFNIHYSRTQNLLTFTDTKRPGRFFKPTSALKFYQAGMRSLFRRIAMWLISQVETVCIGKKSKYASRIMDRCLIAKDSLQQQRAD